VVTKLHVDDIFLNLDTAVPLGLMINEIFTNAFKHGVKDQEKGRIYITIEKKGDGYVMLIGDNGPGFFNGCDFDLGETMGMLLLQNLADQMDGELTLLTKEKGVHYKFEFKEVMKG
jgi:two-component sensor histidine kinase